MINTYFQSNMLYKMAEYYLYTLILLYKYLFLPALHSIYFIMGVNN